MNVGYSPCGEDLVSIDTQYVHLEQLPELNENELNIIHINIRGLISKQEKLSRLLTRLGGRNKVSVVSLNETWLRSETVKNVNVPGYNYVGSVRKGKTGGGVGLLISEDIRYRNVDILPHTNTFECHCIELKLPSSNVLISTLYRLPNKPLKETLEDTKLIFDCLNRDKRHKVLCMDHNLDLLKSDYHRGTQDFVELALSSGLMTTINKPTRITNYSATLIDNIFINRELYSDCKSTLVLDDMSDHLPCLLTIQNMVPDKKAQNWQLKRKIDKNTLKAIKSNLNEQDWEETLYHQSCNESFNRFHDRLTSILDKHAPEKLVPTKVKKSVQPWVTKGLRKCLLKQSKLYALSIVRPISPKAVDMYKNYKTCLQHTIRNSKRHYYSDLCYKYRSNTKKMWQLINAITKKEVNKSNVVDRLDIKNLKIHDTKEIANVFADHFANIGKTYAKATPSPQKCATEYIKSIKNSQKTMFLEPTTEHEVDRLIDSLKNKKVVDMIK